MLLYISSPNIGKKQDRVRNGILLTTLIIHIAPPYSEFKCDSSDVSMLFSN